MESTITTLPSMLVVGLGAHFISILSPDATASDVIPKLWHDYIGRRAEIPHRSSEVSLGVCFVLSAALRSHPHECYYLACAEVDQLREIPDGMVARDIHAGTYARYTHRGAISGLKDTYAAIYKHVADSVDYVRTEGPEIEWYDERFQGGGEESAFDIYIPVETVRR